MSNDTQHEENVVLEARNITKRFPGVLANSNVSFKLRRGEILALLGENGAGKSTLMNIIYGLYHQDEGEVLLKGREVRFTNPREAIHSGIGMVHQHFQLVNVMNVAENVVLGEEKEIPDHRSLFGTFFALLLGFSIAFQLTRGMSLLEAIWGKLTGRLESSELIFETIAFLFVGIFLPVLIAGKLSGWLKTPTTFARMRQDIFLILLHVIIQLVLVGLTLRFGFTGVVTLLWIFWAFVLIFYALEWFIQLWNKNFAQYIFFTVIVLPIIYIFTQSHLEGAKILIFIAACVATVLASFAFLLRYQDQPRWRIGFYAIQASVYTLLILLLNYSISATLTFLIPLAVVVILCAAFAEVLAMFFEVIFQHWDQVVDGLRVAWGVIWRVSLVLVALQIGGQVYRVAQMGIVTAMLQSTPDTTTFQDATGKGGIKDDPLAKGGFTYYKEVDVPWGNLKSQAPEYENQVNLLLAEIDETFQEPKPYENVGTEYTSRAQTTQWSGLNPVWRSAVYDTPPLVEEMMVALLMLLFAFLGIRSWRGWKQFPTVLSEIDLAILALIGGYYLVQLFILPDHLGAIWRFVFVLLGLVVIGGTIYWTYQHRLRHQDKILPIFPLDIAIDALTSSTYIAASVRDTTEAAERVRQLSRQYGLEVDPDAIIEKLPVGSQQRVEIVKALYRRADILILDEPTAVLTPQEGKELFHIMRDLAAQGVSIIFITHKLKEVFEVATRIVVMRDGAVVGEAIPGESTESSLAAMMVGREVLLQVKKGEAQPAEPVLEVHHLEATDDRGSVAVKGVSFEVRAGEVLGIAGVQGNGQSELVEVLTGLRHLNKGSVYVMGQELRPEVSANANPWRRFGALVLDSALIGLLTLITYGMYTYFAPGKGNLRVGLYIFLLIDVIVTNVCWQVWRRTFGKTAMQIEIESSEQFSLTLWGIDFNLILRYVPQIFVRFPLIYAGLIFASALHDTPFHDIKSVGNVFTEIGRFISYLVKHDFLIPMSIGLATHLGTFMQIQRDPQHQAWYDKLGFIRARVVKHAVISPRRIKDMKVAHVPEDRLKFGLVKPFTIAENLILNDYYEQPYAEAPTKSQTLPLFAIYASIFAMIFYVLANIWDSFWLTTWGNILENYGVPGLYKTVPTTRALNSAENFYLSDPLLIAILSLLVVCLVFAIISHIGAFAIITPLRRRLNKTNTIGGVLLGMGQSVGHANELIEEFDIRTPSALNSGGSLSGGNQQKVVVAREFSRKPRLLIASQPTRGIDVGSIEFIHNQIITQRDQGAGVLLVSAELDEVMSLSDRIAVMYRGEIIDVVEAKTASREQLGLLMAGIK